MLFCNPDSSIWFPTVRYSPSTRLRLFCFPYAGGGISVFRTWEKYFPESVEVCPIQLPGRSARFLESPIVQFSSLIKAIIKKIRPFLDKPFAFFGHSLGGLIAYEISHQLRSNYSIEPTHLIISGCASPCCKTKRKVLSNLPDQELISELRKLNGTPDELLDSEEFMALSLPSLRADFALYESYQYSSRVPLECPLTVFGGMEDREVDWRQLELWKNETEGMFSLYQLPGDHFFLHKEEITVLRFILRNLGI